MRRDRAECHAAVWRLLAADPTRPIDEGLFEEAGEHVVDEKGRHPSASTVSRRYYEALRDGALDLAVFKTATCHELANL